MELWEKYIAYDVPVVIPEWIDKMTEEELDEYLEKNLKEVEEMKNNK